MVKSTEHDTVAVRGYPTSKNPSESSAQRATLDDATASVFPPLGVRWTIGDVSAEGFEALGLSVWGAWKLFGAHAEYAICCNTIPLGRAQELTGVLPDAIQWLDVNGAIPGWLRAYMDAGMAEGVGWKFAPLRVFSDRFELALDNDCVLWSLPNAVRIALADQEPRCVVAEDVRVCFGQFEDLCPVQPRNMGIRGVPAGFDLERAIRSVLERRDIVLKSETDEQGLQVAALCAAREPLVVQTDEVTICSPFPPHADFLGRCGAHFVGLNARHLPWDYYGRPASDVLREHWREYRETVRDRVGLMSERI